MKRVRTIIVVLLVTLLVWVFAENESLQTQDMDVSVRLATGREERLIDPLASDDRQPWDGGATISVEGSAASMDRLRSALAGGVTLTGGDELTLAEGPNTIDLVTALRAHDAFRGVVVRESDPRTLDVRVDTLVERDLPIVGVVDGAEVVGAPTPSPATVRIRAPKRLLDPLGEDATGIARLTPEMLGAAAEGRPETIRGVRVRAPEGLAGLPSVTLEPALVDVEITLRSRTAEITLPTTPVHVRLPAVELGRWDVSIVGGTVLSDVRVSGPAEQIERIRSGDLPIVAVVSLTFDELERGIASKPARFTSLPTSLSFEVEDPVVRLEIRRRADPAGTE